MNVKQGDRVIVQKINDLIFNGLHPNGINVGYTQIGELREDVTIGQRCVIVGNRLGDYLSTSKVTEIVDDDTFRTENSIYKIYKHEDNSNFHI